MSLMTSFGERGGANPPSWDGSLASAATYEKELRWYVLGVDEDKRALCGPRAVRALSGRAAEIAMSMAADDIAQVAAVNAPSSWTM